MPQILPVPTGLISWMRHIGFTTAPVTTIDGSQRIVPQVVQLLEVTCPADVIATQFDGQDQFFGGRQIDWVPNSFLPIMETSFRCCFHVNDCPRIAVGQTCFPTGVPVTFGVYVVDNANFGLPLNGNCFSSQGQVFTLKFCYTDPAVGAAYNANLPPGCPKIETCSGPMIVCDDALPCHDDSTGAGVGGRWEGSITLRAGTLNLKMGIRSCDFHPDIGQFIPTFCMTWSGCGQTCHTTEDPFLICNDPWLFHHIVGGVNNCCDCAPVPAPYQSIHGFSLWIDGGCRKTVKARHIDYTPPVALQNGSGTARVAVVAVTSDCDSHDIQATGCLIMTCPLIATLTGSCTVINGTYNMYYEDDAFFKGYTEYPVGIIAGGKTYHLHMTCQDHRNIAGDILSVTYTFCIFCVPNLGLGGGCGTVTLTGTTELDLQTQIENLDITFVIPMEGDSGCCSGGSETVRVVRA